VARRRAIVSHRQLNQGSRARGPGCRLKGRGATAYLANLSRESFSLGLCGEPC